MMVFGNMKNVKAVATLALYLCVVNVKAMQPVTPEVGPHVDARTLQTDVQYRDWVKANFFTWGKDKIDNTQEELELWKLHVFKVAHEKFYCEDINPNTCSRGNPNHEFDKYLKDYHGTYWEKIKKASKEVGPINDKWQKKNNESAKANNGNFYCQNKDCEQLAEGFGASVTATGASVESLVLAAVGASVGSEVSGVSAPHNEIYGGPLTPVFRPVGRQVFPGKLFKDWPHHCRQCGEVFCKHCSKLKLRFKVGDAIKEKRVCNFCYWLYPKKRPTPATRRRLASDSTSPPIRRLEQLIRNQQ